MKHGSGERDDPLLAVDHVESVSGGGRVDGREPRITRSAPAGRLEKRNSPMGKPR
jgi:hypothetical protein